MIANPLARHAPGQPYVLLFEHHRIGLGEPPQCRVVPPRHVVVQPNPAVQPLAGVPVRRGLCSVTMVSALQRVTEQQTRDS